MCAVSSARLSPTIALNATAMPRSFKTSVMYSELVSVFCGRQQLAADGDDRRTQAVSHAGIIHTHRRSAR